MIPIWCYGCWYISLQIWSNLKRFKNVIIINFETVGVKTLWKSNYTAQWSAPNPSSIDELWMELETVTIMPKNKPCEEVWLGLQFCKVWINTWLLFCHLLSYLFETNKHKISVWTSSLVKGSQKVTLFKILKIQLCSIWN